jgi:hypothetical protein
MGARKWQPSDEEVIPRSEQYLSERIPPALLERLTALKPVLEQQGCLHFRPHRVRWKAFRVRFRDNDATTGRVVQRTIEVGGDEPACYVEQLLKLWQTERHERERAARDAEAQARAQMRTDRRRWRLYRRILQLATSGGPRQQQRIGKMFDEAQAKGPAHLFLFTYKVEHLRPPKPGRPRKGRLW